MSQHGHGWGRVLVLALVMAAVWILLPNWAYAQKNVTSAFDVRLGGYVQMNVTWDEDESPDSANNLRANSVVKGSAQDGRETLRWGSFRTRLFMDVRGPDLWGAKSRAYIETDFDNQQAGTATAAHTPRMRRAYMRFDWPGFYVLIGQDTLLVSNAVSSQTELSGTASGNRGDITGGARNRTPQIQVGTSIPMMGAKLDLAAAVSRNQTDRDSNDTNLNDSGARAVTPAVSGIAKATLPIFGRDAVFAVSGFLGKEKFVQATGPAEKTVDNTAFVVEALLPLGPAIPGIGAFHVRGNWGTYENMSRVNLSSDGAGVTTTDATKNPKEIKSDGGWAGLGWEVNKNWTVGAEYGRMEDDKGDLIQAGGTRVKENHGWWAFVQWSDGPWFFELLYGVATTKRLTTSTGAEVENDSSAVHAIFRYRF